MKRLSKEEWQKQQDNKPIGVRKQEFVKWLMKQGVELEEAKLICYRKFYREEHARIW